MSGTHLLLLNEPVGSELIAVLDDLVDEGAERLVHVVVPATAPSDAELEYVRVESDGDGVDPAVQLADWRLSAATRQLERHGFTVHGVVAEADPVAAVLSFVAQGWPLRGLIVTTPHAGPSRWFHRDLPSRLERESTLPVVAVVTDDAPVAMA